MFTGLVQQLGTVEGVGASGSKLRLGLDLGEMARNVAIGDSVMVSGVCLTAEWIDGSIVFFDVVRETVSRTILSDLRKGDKVNLELALRLNDRLGGHLISGHVDGVGRIKSLRKTPGEWRLAVDAPPEVMRYLVEKGSVAVDGISLTVAALSARGFEVAVIPHTAAVTTLAQARVGGRVNLEGDMIGRWVARFLTCAAGNEKSELSEKLRKSGFFQ
jgi:riboflavin synthase